MGHCKKWTSEELGVLAVAYVNAMSNAIKGTDQTKDDFVKDILDLLAGDGTADCKDLCLADSQKT